MNIPDTIRIAILDLYNGEPNEGMRGIRQLVEDFGRTQQPVSYDIFDVRGKAAVPDTSYDIYISSGGPGSPLDTAGTLWEQRYFHLMDALKAHNREHPSLKKHVFLICHSIQIFTRYYNYALVSKRKSTSFGVMPGHMTETGKHDPLLRSLADPFWAIDSRDYQITKPNVALIEARGGSVLCIEKYRPYVQLERAVMAIRFDDAFFGTQFHPEADSSGMYKYLLCEDKKKQVIEKHGERKYWEMLEYVNDPAKVMKTYNTIIPRFLAIAVQQRLASVPS